MCPFRLTDELIVRVSSLRLLIKDRRTRLVEEPDAAAVGVAVALHDK
jgi:hypothetical protein